VRRAAALLALSLGCTGVGALEPPHPSQGLDPATAADAVRQALELCAERAVGRTSRSDGFLGNSLIRISTPKDLDRMVRGLRVMGLGAKVEEIEVAMNRAAERASGEGVEVFRGVIRGIPIADAARILRGGDTAATLHLRAHGSDALRQRYLPIVSRAMERVDLVSLYDRLVGRYEALPLATAPTFDLRRYVTDESLDGLFTVLGEEETRIRRDPAARTTPLLETVFGAS